MKVIVSASDNSRRKPKATTVWSREKITKLIQLYKENACLWNHYTEFYKSKEHRNNAITCICAALCISKFDFCKKIHNLRNQFNSEMKKMDRRFEEAGGSAETDAVVYQRCRWEHFEALKFLRLVIEPRPGRLRQSPQPQSPLKKMKMIETNYGGHEPNLLLPSQNANVGGAKVSAENAVEYQIEDVTGDEDDTSLAEDFESYVEEVEPQAASANIGDHKYHTPAPHFKVVSTATTQQEPKTNTNALSPHHTPEQNKPYQTRLQSVQHKKQQQTRQHNESIQLEAEVNQHSVAAADVEPTQATPSCSATNSSHLTSASTSTNLFSCSPNQKSHPKTTSSSRDQWDSFGELIASEFRHLNSDLSRKLLKRKIMQAMLEIGEQDDSICTAN